MTPSEKTLLRRVELHGPAFAGESFWQVVLGSPQHRLGPVLPPKSGTQLERTHPVRTLLLEVVARDGPVDKDDKLPWHRARLLSTHLIGGVSGRWSDDGCNFQIRIGGRDWPAESSQDGATFRTDELEGKHSGGPKFHHLTAAPLLRGDNWPLELDSGSNPDIACPPCRLEQGALALLFKSAAGLPWIDVKALGLQPVEQQDDPKKKHYRLVLVKDGIEIAAHAPFPGVDKPLPGHFLLAPVPDPAPLRPEQLAELNAEELERELERGWERGWERGLTLRLLPEKLSPEERELWLAAWSKLAPDEDNSEQLAGFKVLLDKRTVPAFSWRVKLSDRRRPPFKIVGLHPEVKVPATAVHVRLLGPQGLLDREGEITLAPGEWILSPKQNPGALAEENLRKASRPVWNQPPPDWITVGSEVAQWESPVILSALIVPPPPENQVLLQSPSSSLRLYTAAQEDPLEGSLRLHTNKGHLLAHDEILLAAALRTAQGLPEPAPGQADPARPLLWGFTPLDQGWLQLPFPNLPRPDPAKDASLIRLPGVTPPNVVSGFLRYGEAQAWPQVLSVFPEPPVLAVEKAPWLVTMEGAQGVAVAIGLGTDATDHGEPRQAVARLLGPELSTRGLLWLSSDRPDALEALPRIGAGAGQYLDVPLESHDVELDPIVPVALHEWSFSMSPPVARQQSEVKRLGLQIGIDFDATCTKWRTLFERIPEPDPPETPLEIETAWAEFFRTSWSVLFAAAPPDDLFRLPPVLWLRHPVMPLSSLMSMTRSASAGVPPLESRDLIPYAQEAAADGIPHPLLLEWDGAQEVFPAVNDGTSGQAPRLLPLCGWPWGQHAGSAAIDNPAEVEQGIGLCAFGVPGAELNFTTLNPSATPWAQLKFALRFDLPALDEAFATAALPPAPPLKTPDQTDLPPPAVPLATALDWREMKALWVFKEERHRLARVMHSYLSPYAALDAEVEREVFELVGGATWTTPLNFTSGSSGERLPYGAATVGGTTANGNRALLGFSGTPTLEWGNGDATPVDITGYAPATILDGEYLTDARGTGMGAMSQEADTPFWSRPLRVRSGTEQQDYELITLKKPLKILLGENMRLFSFRFKDLPVHYTAPGPARGPVLTLGLSPLAWQDGNLPLSGVEWSLCAHHPKVALAAFQRGHNRIPFFGFALEPLQLTACTFAADMSHVVSVTIRARLHLGPRQAAFLPAGNLVKLTFTGEPGLDALRLTNCVGTTAVVDENGVEVEEHARLRFHLEVLELDGQPTRNVEVSAALGWDDDAKRPSFTQVEVELPVFQRPTTFEDAEIIATAEPTPADPVPVDPAAVIIRWKRIHEPDNPEEQDEPATLQAGEAKLGVSGFEIRAYTEITANPVPSTMDMGRWVALLPALSPEEEATATPALVFKLESTEGRLDTSLKVFGQEVQAEPSFKEHRDALSLTLDQSDLFTVWPQLGLQGRISLGLIARVEPLQDGLADLVAGHLSSRWVSPKTAADHAAGQVRPSPDRILLEAGCSVRGVPGFQGWLGALTLHLHVKVDSAIRWPALKDFIARPIPWPPVEKPPSNSRVTLDFDASKPVHHEVSYFVDGHRMSCAVAAMLAMPEDADAVFALPVAARHRFLRDKQPVLEFSAVETVALGRALALIPEAGDPGGGDEEGYELDPIAFGARYRNLVGGGQVLNGNHTAGMTVAGRGRISKLLSGTLGHAFRASFWARVSVTDNPLVLAGGFVGLAEWEGGEAASPQFPMMPLLRVPLVAWPGTPVFLDQSEASLTLAWPDTPVALPVAASLRSAAVPASSAFSALCAAIQQSAPSRGIILEEGFESAALVEQSFRLEMDQDEAMPLDTTNFFPAAAASISGMIERATKRTEATGKMEAPMTLSLLAGRTRVRVGDEVLLETFSASLLLRGQDWARMGEVLGTVQQALDPAAAGSRLATLGDDVVLSPWNGPRAEESRALISTRAVADHAEPLAALVLRIEQDGAVRCTAQAPAGQRTRAVYRQPVPVSVFADPARGYPMSWEGQGGWLRGLEEGITRPFRDADVPAADPDAEEPETAITRSGLAGLSHPLSLPRQTLGAEAPVYFAETRVPVYQPRLDLRQLESPPIPWLEPGHTRPRLPTEAALERALKELFGEQAFAEPAFAGAAPGGEDRGEFFKFFQWILPAGGVSASVGDRSGILLARVSRLETPLRQVPFFDAGHDRFGRPGLGSSWSVRTERTPRPGPLPQNRGVRERDRRPCASGLEFWRPLEALRGPADTVSGEPSRNPQTGHGAWVVKMVAAADWAGMITDRWDATVTLDVEIDLSAPTAMTPWDFLQSVLLPPVDPDDPNNPDDPVDLSRQAYAELVVGELVIPFQRLHLLRADATFATLEVTVAGEARTLHRATLRLALDARLDVGGPGQAGAPLTALGQVLNAAALLPRVEIRFTLHPDSNRNLPLAPPILIPDPPPPLPPAPIVVPQPPRLVLSLTLADPLKPAMPSGESRPPVTLRLPLAPVVRSRGALPLPLNSLLFIDPAYDEELGSAPAVHRERVVRPRFAVPADELPPNRGELIGSLYADRARANRRSGIVLMADLAFEKPLPATEQWIADRAKIINDPDGIEKEGTDGGDLMDEANLKPLALTFAVTTPQGERRELYFGLPVAAPLPETAPLPEPPDVRMARVYELSFSLLREKDGTAARLHTGDMLELTVTEKTQLVSENGTPVPRLITGARLKPRIWHPGRGANVDLAGLDNSGAADPVKDIPFSRTVRVLMTDEPVIEPPSALYAALTRRVLPGQAEEAEETRETRLSLPLYAQSPLPWRVVLRDAKADFRRGYMRRAATFVWSLSRPSSETALTGVHIVKVDRNGQTYLPPDTNLANDFVSSRPIV